MKHILIFVNLLLFCALCHAQEYGMGLERSREKAAELPQKVEYLTRDFTVLPSSYSLEKYCPTPMSQGSYGTCTAWSSAFAARTIAEAIAYGWTDKSRINSEVFSPWFVYTNIKLTHIYPNDYNCKQGTYIEDAVKLMYTKGVPKMSDYATPCEISVPQFAFSKAYQYRIDEYTSLFSDAHPVANDNEILKVKMSIANNRPVIIAAECYGSFHAAKDCWNGVCENKPGYHAMCVVAYDDYKYGGAFLIQNSWGTYWGNGGYTWCRYSDFARIVYEAIEIYVKPKSFISRPNSLSGTLRLQLSTGEEMRGTLGANGVYKISGEYISGTRYRIYISNNEPAYVYVIGSDLQNNVSKVFPPNDRISPALTYKSNNIAIPDENWFVQMDNTVGKDYVCVLYSAQELDINTIISKIRSGYGSFPEKVSAALSGKIVPASDVRFSQNSISFSASTNKSVVALIAEVVHK